MEVKYWQVYNINSGKILSMYITKGLDSAPDPLFNYFGGDTNMRELDINNIDDPSLYYVDINNPTNSIARPSTPCSIDKTTITADGTDYATISNIPIGTELIVKDSTGTNIFTTDNSGTFEIYSNEPDTIYISMEFFPEKDFYVEVTAS